MRALIQRVSHARVLVDDELRSEIGSGLLILLGVGQDDGDAQARWLAEKVGQLRIFEDTQGKMNLSLVDVAGSALVVSQFTLFGDCKKGRRPSFVGAARPERAQELYLLFVAELRKRVGEVQEGVFQTHMAVELTNDGPVTLWLDTAEFTR